MAFRTWFLVLRYLAPLGVFLSTQKVSGTSLVGSGKTPDYSAFVVSLQYMNYLALTMPVQVLKQKVCTPDAI